MSSVLNEFIKFPKIMRFGNAEVQITEKIDGTNAQVRIPVEVGEPLVVGSRNRLITPGKTTDNFGFAAWVYEHEELIRALGPGLHYGEWFGPGIGRTYGLAERRWALFAQYGELPEHPQLTRVPMLYRGQMSDYFSYDLRHVINNLKISGSVAVPGWYKPEGVVVNIEGHRLKVVFDKTGPSPEE